MKFNRSIEITQHACKRLIEKFQFAKNLHNDEDAMRSAEQILRTVFETARYVSDDSDGVLFRHNDYGMQMIVHERRLITVFPIKSGEHQPENHSRMDLELSGKKSQRPEVRGQNNFNSRFRKQTDRR